MATGIRKRHSTPCASHDGGRCNCGAGWEASVFDKRSGQRIRKTFDQQGDAKAWRADQQVAMGKGKSITPKKVTLRELADEFMEAAEGGQAPSRRGQPYKPATLRGYRQALDQRILPQLGALRVSEVRRMDVQDIADRMLAEGFDPSTVQGAMDPLRAIYRRAVQREVVAENPTRALDIPRSSGRRNRTATPGEAAALIEALPASERALWATSFYAGLRRGELMALRWSDVDLGRSKLRVERGWDDYEGEQGTKSKAGERTIPILAVLRDHLDEHKLATGREGEALVFGRDAEKPFTPTAVNQRAKQTWRAANLTGLTMHECRHTFASLLIDSGANAKAVQEYMGHASITMTFDTYGHLLPGSRDEVRERMDSYLAACVDGASVDSPEQPVAAVIEDVGDPQDLAL